MKKIFPAFLVLLLVSVAFAAPVLAKTTPKGFTESVTADEVRAAYANAGTGGDPVRILIVPGHEPGYGGAVFQGEYEREITVEIANELARELEQNPHYEVIVARTSDAWNDDLARYFDRNMKTVKKFVDTQKKLMAKLVKKGTVNTRGDEEQVDHATAPDEVALRLYGINKWANENDIDLVLSLHINDAPDHGDDAPGANSGFAVYIPDPQYGNGTASRPIGEAIAHRLSQMNATSTLPGESAGVVEDQELIALGSYGTLNVPSVLVEYSYITESKFLHPEVRKTVTDDYAYETYLGLQDFFKDPVPVKYPTRTLPYTFMDTPTVGSSTSVAYALQAGLHTLGFYPTATTTLGTTTVRTLTNCPISGLMDLCTVDGIKAFQRSHGLEQTGALGPKTKAAINILLGVY